MTKIVWTVLVPLKPTPEMIQAAIAAIDAHDEKMTAKNGGYYYPEKKTLVSIAWKAMVKHVKEQNP